MTDDAEPLAADFPTNRKAMTDAELSAEARKAAPLYGNDWGSLLIRMADRLDERAREPENKITVEMLDAAEGVIWSEVGGEDVRESFSARELASKVYLAMAEVRRLQSR